MNGLRQLIVKVQHPLVDLAKTVTVKDQAQSVCFDAPITPEIRRAMKGKLNGYFVAEIEGTGATAKLISIKAEARKQFF